MKIFAALLLLALLSGCVYTQVETASHAKMTRISLFGDQSAAAVDLNAGTLKGYSSQQTEAAAAVAEGVARGIASATK